MTSARPTYIDLFSGCGGLSLGFDKAGLECVAAIDFDKSAVETLRLNSPSKRLVLHEDLTRFKPEHLARLADIHRVDVIAGGPPCQGYSTARQRDGANHGARLIRDPRRFLFREFLKYVDYFKPSIFVMENVLGLRSAENGKHFAAVQAEARHMGYRVHGEEICAWRFGVPQKRVRQLIIGTRTELPIFAARRYIRETHALEDEAGSPAQARAVTLWEAIGDLPILAAGDGKYEQRYDQSRRRRHISIYGERYLRDVLEVHKSELLTSHQSRPHNARDLRDFGRLKEGEHGVAAIARGEPMEFPYDRETFKDRFTRQHRHGLCSTIVAHLSKDGLMFVHPTQLRSLTPREAARVQSFPDWFRFPVARTHAFRLIGNAVPPLVARAIGLGLTRYLSEGDLPKQRGACQFLPRSRADAIDALLTALESSRGSDIRHLGDAKFRRGWLSIGFLFPDLHPDSVDASSTSASGRAVEYEDLEALRPYLGRRSELSGWPSGLVAFAMEARRRLDGGGLELDEYYFSSAQMLGFRRSRGHEESTR